MNSVHDMGGMHGMGPVEIEKDEPVYHSKWEARVHALNIACGYHRKWNIDVGRHSIERIPPAEYLAATYYEKWLRRLEMLLVENGLLTAKELATGRAESKATGLKALRAPEVANYLRTRRNARVDEGPPPKFKPGERVLTHNDHPVGHTRLPRYARGKRGVIDRDHGVFIFPDTHAMTRDKKPQHCYSVRFAARGEPDDGTHYYEHWLAALEKLVARKKLVPGQELERRVDEWDAAARSTPHGRPIELPRR